MSIGSSLGSALGGIGSIVGTVAERDLGHALNAGQNLITHGSLHAAPGQLNNNVGTGLIMDARKSPVPTIADISGNGYGQATVANSGQKGSSGASTQNTNQNVLNDSNGGASGASYGTTGTSTGTGVTGNQADIAAYQDNINSINQLLHQADISKQNGMDAINRNYLSGQNQLQDQQNQALQGYNTQRSNTNQAYQQNQQQINQNSRMGLNSLQRLLAGSGSALSVLAPYLVSQQANQQKTASSDAYAQNQQALDQAIQNAKYNYKNALDSLLGQKNDKLSQLLSSIDQQKINLQQQLGAANNQLAIAQGGGYTTPTAQNDAIKQLMAEENGLASQYADPVFQVQHVTTQAPDLSSYQANAATFGGGNNQPNTNPSSDANNALAAFLASQQKQQQNNVNPYSY